MPSSSGPNTVNDSLIFAYDVADIRNSYIGEPTTNLLPTPETNAIPKIGNGWGTFNVNQYNGGNYFSIGTISSVSSNVVTTAGTHPLRTYDAVTPQTTGGGVTNGTNYFVKKISDTQFSLHEYNGSQDGSQGYISTSTGTFKVYDSIATDTRVSINSTSFPTMWWGPPHVPNSGLVKEIISNGFKDPYTAIVTDCVRLHWHRPDGVTDGMAYGVDATTTPSTTTTVSFWARAANAAAVGNYIQFQNYNYSGPEGYSYYSMNATWGALGEWVRNSYTFTATHNALISYWFPSAANMDVDISNIQVEQNSHRTTFVAGTRSVTNSLLDLSVTGKTIDVTNVSFDSNSQITFDATNDYINTSFSAQTISNVTIEAIVYDTRNNGGYRAIVQSNLNSDDALYIYPNNTLGFWPCGGGSLTVPANQWNHVVASYNGGSIIYSVNGVSQTVNTVCSDITNWEFLRIGAHGVGDGERWGGQISVVKVYNRALTQSEIANNYRAYKSRFNLS
jgi:hypothetical protein